MMINIICITKYECQYCSNKLATILSQLQTDCVPIIKIYQLEKPTQLQIFQNKAIIKQQWMYVKYSLPQECTQ